MAELNSPFPTPTPAYYHVLSPPFVNLISYQIASPWRRKRLDFGLVAGGSGSG